MYSYISCSVGGGREKSAIDLALVSLLIAINTSLKLFDHPSQWGTYTLDDGHRQNEVKRPEFRGKMRRSPITGQMEHYYPASQRWLKYAVSAAVTLCLLAGTGFIMVVSMNLQGYISSADAELWGDHPLRNYEEHPLYFPFFARLAEEGGIFDASHPVKSFVPIILRALVVMTINQRYSRFAETLAAWENHETVNGHRGSVILKRVLFEAFDAYIILFYLMVCERDVSMLRLELVGCFNMGECEPPCFGSNGIHNLEPYRMGQINGSSTFAIFSRSLTLPALRPDTIRRVAVECVLPCVTNYFAKDKKSASKKDDDQDKTGHLTAEAELEAYDSFGES